MAYQMHKMMFATWNSFTLFDLFMKKTFKCAFEYKQDEHKRQKQIRLSLWAFVALLISVLLLALLLGKQAIITLLGK